MSNWMPPPPATNPSTSKEGRRKWIFAGIGIVLAASAILWSCGKTAYRNYRIAGEAVDHFHEQLNRQDYDGIYEEASDEFRTFGSRADDGKFFASVHEKLGTSGDKSPRGFHVNWRNGRTWVDQVYQTQFTLGSGQESFIWIVDHDRARLYGYHINSANLK